LIGGRHRLLAIAGRGGMGVVWRAHDEASGRLTAVKFPLFTGPSRARAETAFLREVLTTGASRHPNVVSVVDHGRTADGRLYIAFELLDGEDLAVTLEQVGRLPVAAAAWIGIQVVQGLAAAHLRGIVHRDIKPSNIILVRSDARICAAKLIDFGLAWVSAMESGGAPGSGPVLGTPAYMSPEVCAGRPATAASDRYGVGCLLYHLVVGKQLFSGTVDAISHQHQFTQATEIPEQIDGEQVPPAFRDLVAALLEKQPGMRPQSEVQIAATLARLAGHASARELGGITGLQFAPLNELAPAGPADMELSRNIFGREHERSRLDELVQHLQRTRRGGIAVLRGPEGIGKTHLGLWLADQARTRAGARVLHRSLAQTHGTAMPAIRDLVEDLLGLRDADVRRCEAVVWAAIDRASAAERYQAQALLRFLRPDAHMPVTVAGDAQVRRAALFAAILRPFLREAKRQPLMLLFDDVHAADPMTVEWLATLMAMIRRDTAPILLCTTQRDTPADTVSPVDITLQHIGTHDESVMRQLTLAPLPMDACAAWLDQSGRFDPALVQHLTQVADGNPLLLETALTGYVADGRVQVRDGCWRAVVPLRCDGTLVDRLRTTVAEELGAFLRRQQRHRKHLQALLHVLAVAGAPQPLDHARDMFLALVGQDDSGAAFAQSVALAAAAGLLARATDAGREEIRLRHGTVGEVVLARFADSAAAAHRAVASVLRERGVAAPVYVPHLWRCGEWAEAWQATRRGVAESAQLLDNHGTNRLLDEAERFGEPAGLLTMADLAWLLRHRGEALLALAQYDEAQARFQELSALAESAIVSGGDLAQDSGVLADIGLAAVCEARADLSDALGYLDRALGAAADSAALRGRIHALRATSLRALTRYAEAGVELEAAQRCLAAAGDRGGALETRIEQAMTAALTSDLDRSEMLLQALEPGLAREGDPFLHARFEYVSGTVSDARRNYGESVRHYTAALGPLRTIGHRRGECAVMANLAVAHHYLKDFQAAERMHLDALRVREEIGDHRGIASSCNNIADLYIVMGRPKDAIPVAMRAMHEARRLGALHSEAVAWSTMAQAQLAIQDLDAAQSAALEALRLHGEPPRWRRTRAACLATLASIASARGDFERAYQMMLQVDQLKGS